jgi:hypothetical protein
MTTVFEKSDEWGGYTIYPGTTGFILEYHTHMEGERDGIKILVPYGTWGFHSEIDLDAPHDEIACHGETLADLAMADAQVRFEERKVELLSEGVVLGSSRGPARVTEGGREEAQQTGKEGTGEDGSSWYTFSLKKEDEGGYGACHDLFTIMYLTHGLPHGMALWTTSNFATDENMFFAQIPAGMQVQEDEFFRTFPLTGCERPAEADLLMMVGHLEERRDFYPAGKRRRRWRFSKGAATKAA